VCCVSTCRYVMRPESERRFFTFPLDNRPLLLDWLEAIKCDETFELTQNTVICSAHFSSSDYVMENGTYELSNTAIPKLMYEVKFIDRPNRPKTPIIVEVRGAYDLNLGFVGSSASNYKGSGSTNITNMMESSIETSLNNIGSQQGQEDNLRASLLNEMSSEINSRLVNDGASTSSMNLPNLAFKPTNKSCRKNNATVMSNRMYSTVNCNKNQNDLTSNFHLINNGASTSFMHPQNYELNSTNKSKYVNNNTGPRKPLMRKLRTPHNKDKYFWVSVKPSVACQCPLHNKCCKKLLQIRIQNRRLRKKIKNMVTRRRDVLDFKVKYLQLRQNVTDAEEQLLSIGVDTKKYSAFRMVSSNLEIPRNVEYDVLLECKLDEMNENSNRDSTLQSDEFPTIVHTSPKSEI